MAAISALEALKRPCTVDLHTDSEYLKNGITTWIHGWKKNGWRTADKKPVKNVDLWKRLDEALGHHKVHWHWVKGHAGHAMNERADELAREGHCRRARRRDRRDEDKIVPRNIRESGTSGRFPAIAGMRGTGRECESRAVPATSGRRKSRTCRAHPRY